MTIRIIKSVVRVTGPLNRRQPTC